MAAMLVKSLFENNIHRRIEEVIKVDQTEEEILRDEISEYVVTDSINRHLFDVFDRYADMPNKPNDGVAIWVSGFFGSGKSSFAKNIGLAIGNPMVAGQPAAQRFTARTSDPRIRVSLDRITSKIPTHTVIFDVSTDRGIKSGNQTLTEIMYRLFLQSLNYAKDLDLSELEITLESEGRLDTFKQTYTKLVGKEWDKEKGKVVFALSEASRVMHELEPKTFPLADSWVKAVKDKTDITPNKLADRCTELMKRRGHNKSLLFVVDEVGQFVARDVQKMLDLQAIVQSLGRVGRGKHWIAVTSQEKLSEVVSGLDDKRIELARLMDRFPVQVHLEPSDISEVTSRRVLAKNAAAQATLGKLFAEHQARLVHNTRITTDNVKLPALDRDGFIDLYPLLPYQIELIIIAVSGLRMQSGASRHVSGANRTIIKLAQQLLINPVVHLAEANVGALVRLDQVYDLVENNISSEIRAKIAAIPKDVQHPLASRVAKTICLLQHVKTVFRTAENIAAALHPSVDADSQYPLVKEALEELVAKHKVRLGQDGGYRIPTPAEDDWEQMREAILPKAGDVHRLHADALKHFWDSPQQPQHVLLETKTFKAGMALHGREIVSGDIVFHVHLAENANVFPALAAELRTRSQQERKHVFWAVGLNDGIERETRELFRSAEMIARNDRESSKNSGLMAEEKSRRTRHDAELKRLLKAACLKGAVYFRGNDRSPGDRTNDVGRAAAEILAQVLPEVFDRFKDGAARANDLKKGLEAIFTADSLQGLPPVFSALSLLRNEKGKVVFRTDGGPLAEVMSRIEERHNYGDAVSGRHLVDEFAKEPFGWDFDVVRLFVLCLLRAGNIEATSKGQTFEGVAGLEAREIFSNNNYFRQASFRPKRGIIFEDLLKAAEAFRDTFGSEVRELNPTSIAADLRREVARHEDTVTTALSRLLAERLPGAALLEEASGQLKAVLRGSDEHGIAAFGSSHRSIKDAIKRSTEIEQSVTEPRIRDLRRARDALAQAWPFLRHEVDLSDELRQKADKLGDILARETFFREMPTIEQITRAIESEYERRYEEAITARVDAYTKALDRLCRTPGFSELEEDQQRLIAGPLERGKVRPSEPLPIPQLRSERDACDSRLRAAIAEVHRVLEGERLVTVNLAGYFAGGIETEEQLDAALEGIREECSRLIGAGKKVIGQ